MTRSRNSEPSGRKLRFPKFKSYEEEAAWYDAHKQELLDDLRRYGRAVPARMIETTKQLTLRIPVSDIERARKIAADKRLPYQTVLKKAIREGLKKAG